MASIRDLRAIFTMSEESAQLIRFAHPQMPIYVVLSTSQALGCRATSPVLRRLIAVDYRTPAIQDIATILNIRSVVGPIEIIILDELDREQLETTLGAARVVIYDNCVEQPELLSYVKARGAVPIPLFRANLNRLNRQNHAVDVIEEVERELADSMRIAQDSSSSPRRCGAEDKVAIVNVRAEVSLDIVDIWRKLLDVENGSGHIGRCHGGGREGGNPRE